ncbi:MAG: hypothetical protein JW753_07425 [Dehalococcoidia bacterium]|nr:hypothetical protein [Dehalococcoidia bacterium]
MASEWLAKRISVLLTVLALVLWSYSIVQAQFKVGFFGLVSSFPACFFIAVGVLTLASAVLWTSRENHWKLLLLQLCFLIVAIWLAPVVVRGAQPFSYDAYGDMGFVEYITREGHLNPNDLWQHNWPIAWIFWASGIEASGTTVEGLTALIPWIPFLWQSVMILPLFLLFRNTVGRVNPNYSWAAMWVFYLANWFETQNTGAQAFGFFFVIGALSILTLIATRNNKVKSFGHKTFAVVLLAVSAPAHLLGSLIAAAVVAGMTVTRRLRSPNLAILAAVFIVAWSLFGAAAYFEWRLPTLVEQGFRLDVATESGILSPLSGNASHAAVAVVRLAFSAMFLALAALGAFLGWRLRDNRYADVTVLSIVFACLAVAILVGAGYRHELYQRVFTFLLPAIAYFTVKLLHYTPTRAIMVIALVAAVPLVFICRYGNQEIDRLSTDYLSSATFFHEETTAGWVVADLPIGRMKNFEQYRYSVQLDDLGFEDNTLIRTEEMGHDPVYVCLTAHDRAMYEFMLDNPTLVDTVQTSLDSATNCDLIYASPDASIYVSEERD